MAALTRDAIFACDDLPRKEIEVPEWGGSIYIRAHTIREAELLERIDDHAEQGTYLAYIVGLCAVDADGKQLFAPDDVSAIAEKSRSAVKRIAEAIIEMN